MAAEVSTDANSIRNAIRWGLLLAATVTIGFRLPRLWHSFENWREAVRLGDASAAEGWRTFLFVEAISLLIVTAIGLAVFFVLGRRPRSQP